MTRISNILWGSGSVSQPEVVSEESEDRVSPPPADFPFEYKKEETVEPIKEDEIACADLKEACFSVSNIYKKAKSHKIGKIQGSDNDVQAIWFLYTKSAPHLRKVNPEKYSFSSFLDGWMNMKDRYFYQIYSSDDVETVIRYLLSRGTVMAKIEDSFVLVFAFDGPKSRFEYISTGGIKGYISIEDLKSCLKYFPAYACS